MPAATGTLYVVATPIGNLGDLSERARSVLESVDLVACEDTRHTGALLSRLGLRQTLVSLHEHNERRRLPELTARLVSGSSVALVSDAGTPLLSDPGFPLVRAAIAAGCPVVAIPGPSAALAALVTSGLPPYPFTFCGFPPRRSGKRRSFFARFASFDHTLVVLESPHRLLEALADAETMLGDRRAAICRELTKLHEETLRGTLSSVRNALADRERIRGEVVLVIAGRTENAGAEEDEGDPGDAEEWDEEPANEPGEECETEECENEESPG
ncbi:MAG TPA: 16S rRNA (cytidine(1402)-2'-O)-methyltransferase [Thermoanaerobaculia bacterium]|nr:16S rRNA (cytidine(1402)-2'-O)-methyltransferase [Thermoanaerobaculia bacterium]